MRGILLASFAANLLVIHSAQAGSLRLPAVLGDGAVIQQGVPVPIWGWATPGAKVTVTLAGREGRTVASQSGRWKIVLDPASAGLLGELVVNSGRETVVSKGVAAGEVWFCSGQSNMAMNVASSEGGDEAAAAGTDEYLRLLRMPDVCSAQPLSDAPVKWTTATPDAIRQFSAIGYWFGRQLRQEMNIPVGIIAAAWGGTAAETWTDAKSLAGDPELKPILTRWKERVRKEPALALSKEPFRLEIDRLEFVPADGSGPTPIDRSSGGGIPGRWETPWAPGASTARCAVRSQDGRRVFSGEVAMGGSASVTRTLGEDDRGTDLSRFWAIRIRFRGTGRFKMALKSPVVEDWAFHETPVFQAGKDWQELTYMFGDLKQPDWGKKQPIATAAISGVILTASLQLLAYPEMPSCLFNGEVAPVIPLPIRGALWYQGEANAGRAWQYRSLLPAMIGGWRKAWGLGDFPFLIVQLPGWQEPTGNVVDSDWAEMREAQAWVAAEVPECDYVCAIDLGDDADIHPKRKRAVAERLALTAFVRAYGRNAEYSGPRYSGMTIEGGKIRIRFSHVGPGLMIRSGDELKGFGIAGDDRKFERATARIDGDTVVVSSINVPRPAAVRYAWSMNPVCNLWGKIGLPASPFRTDDWPLTTANNR